MKKIASLVLALCMGAFGAYADDAIETNESISASIQMGNSIQVDVDTETVCICPMVVDTNGQEVGRCVLPTITDTNGVTSGGDNLNSVSLTFAEISEKMASEHLTWTQAVPVLFNEKLRAMGVRIVIGR